MTITDSPTTTDQVWSVTEQSITSGSQNKKTPPKQIDRVPRIDAAESVEGFRFVHRVLQANRHLAMTWAASMGWPSGVTRVQAESHGQFLPEPRPTLAQCTTTRDSREWSAASGWAELPTHRRFPADARLCSHARIGATVHGGGWLVGR